MHGVAATYNQPPASMRTITYSSGSMGTRIKEDSTWIRKERVEYHNIGDSEEAGQGFKEEDAGDGWLREKRGRGHLMEASVRCNMAPEPGSVDVRLRLIINRCSAVLGFVRD